jgi:hypothetical protein
MKASIILDAEEIRSKDLYRRICGGLTCAGGSESRRYVYWQASAHAWCTRAKGKAREREEEWSRAMVVRDKKQVV